MRMGVTGEGLAHDNHSNLRASVQSDQANSSTRWRILSPGTSSPSLDPTVPNYAPTLLPSMVLSSNPSSLPSKGPTARPSASPSGQPSCRPSSQPSSQPSLSPSLDPSTEPSASPSPAPRNVSRPYNLADDDWALAAVIGGTLAILVSIACYFWFRCRRKVGVVVRHRPDALTTKDAQKRHDRSSIVPTSNSADSNHQSRSETSTSGDPILLRLPSRSGKKRQHGHSLGPIDSIDENSLYTSTYSARKETSLSLHSRQSHVSYSGGDSLTQEVAAALFPSSNHSRSQSRHSSVTSTSRSSKPHLKELRGIGPLSLDSPQKHGSIAQVKLLPTAHQRKQTKGRVAFEQDTAFTAEGSMSSRRSYASRQSQRSYSSHSGAPKPYLRPERLLGNIHRRQDTLGNYSRSSHNSSSRFGRENSSAHNKSVDGTESSLVVSHISDKDFLADMQSLDSNESPSSVSGRSFSSRSSRPRGGPLADFLESMMKSSNHYRRTSIPQMTPEEREFVPDNDAASGDRKSQAQTNSLPSPKQITSRLWRGDKEDTFGDSFSEDSQSKKVHQRTMMPKKLTTDKDRKATLVRQVTPPSSASSDSSRRDLARLQVGDFDYSNNGQSWEKAESVIDFSVDNASQSSNSSEKSPGNDWLFDAVEQALGPRSMSADMESLGGRSSSGRSRSRERSRRRSVSLDARSRTPRALEQEKERLEIQLASLESEQLSVTSFGASSAAMSFSTRGSRNRPPKVSRKKRIVVVVPPGRLGVVLANRNGGKGTIIAEVRKSSVLHGMITRGDRMVAIDGEDVSMMTMGEITAIMMEKSDQRRRLTILTSVDKINNQYRQP